MALFSIHNTKISSIAACVPKNTRSTADYELMSEKEAKLFEQGTGIKERREASESVCTSDMCFNAAQQLLVENGILPEEIDVLIFVSQSPDYYLPASSILLQERLGLKKSTVAFDVSLGCSGYIYGLAILSNMLTLTGLNKGLLLCGDKSTLSTNHGDKSTYPLFGDAGTATLVVKEESALNTMYFNLQSDGSGESAIIIPGGGTRNPLNKNTMVEREISPGVVRCEKDLVLDGVEVFNFALREVKPNVVDLLAFAAAELDTIDYLVMHQANKLMNESVRKKLKFPMEKTPYSLHKFGNTSSASIPLTIVSELSNQLNGTNQLLLSGFGVGFSWGSVLVETKDVHVCQLVEI